MTIDRNPVITASEIAEYGYCPVAWLLRRQGHKPNSKYLDSGLMTHAKLGEKIEVIQKSERISRNTSYVGYVLLIIALLVLALRWLL